MGPSHVNHEAGLNDVIVNNLIGAAMRSLINADASSAIVGAFAMDYHAKVRRVLQEHSDEEGSTLKRKVRTVGKGLKSLPSSKSSEHSSTSLKHWSDAPELSRETQEAVITIGILNSKTFLRLADLAGPGHALSQTRKIISRFPSDIADPLDWVEANLKCAIEIFLVVGVPDTFKY